MHVRAHTERDTHTHTHSERVFVCDRSVSAQYKYAFLHALIRADIWRHKYYVSLVKVCR